MALFLDDFGRKLPTTDYLMGAQIGDIAMMEAALAHPSVALETLEPMMGYTALHSAAEASSARSAAAVRWLLARGIPWNAIDGRGRLAQEVAEEEENGEAVEVLRAWAVRHEYDLFNTTRRPEDDPYYTKPFYQTRIDGVHANAAFCYTDVQYSDLPPSSCGASKGGRPEVAMICEPEGQGVMMEWERPIMKKTAEMLLEGMPSKGLRILNIGFGLGMIDTYFQEAQPASHVIIEGHPQALAYMRRTGWYAKPGVKVLAGRWQTFLGRACAEHERNFDIGKFDIVYFDTFMEGYRGHHAFIRHVPRLLRGPGSRFSFFHGHGAKKRATTYIYSEVATMHHNDLGLNTEWSEIHIDDETRWESIHKRGEGMGLEHPHLIPISSLAPTVPRTAVSGVAWNPYPSRMHL